MNIKKIIAREGLTLIVWILGTYTLMFIIGLPLDRFIIRNENVSILLLIGALGFWGYILYWFIRFILWAIRTLKREK